VAAEDSLVVLVDQAVAVTLVALVDQEVQVAEVTQDAQAVLVAEAMLVVLKEEAQVDLTVVVDSVQKAKAEIVLVEKENRSVETVNDLNI
jgi:hypothetical protein